MFSKKIKTEVKISGMKCEHCEKNMEEALLKIAGVKKVKADRTRNCAVVTSTTELNEEEVKRAVERLNKTYEGLLKL